MTAMTETHAQLRYDTTMSRSLVHRAAVSEVFLTDSIRLSQGCFLVGAQLPRTHGFFNDSPSRHHDPLLTVETVRQATTMVAHRYYGVPQGYAFVFQSLETRLVDPDAYRLKRTPARVAVELTSLDEDWHRGSLHRLTVGAELAIDGELCASGVGATLMLAPDTYQLFRGAGLGGSQLPISSPPARLLPSQVGRFDARNVVIAAPRRGASATHLTFDVVVDADHPFLFEHVIDHVPGMLMLEAFRQAALASVHKCLDWAPGDVMMTSCRVKFVSFAELDRPASCTASVGAPTRLTEGGAAVSVQLALRQGNALVSTGTIDVARRR